MRKFTEDQAYRTGTLERVSDFGVTWRLSRSRFDDAILNLNHEQLNWRLHPETLTMGEAAIHLAGVEVWFVSQLFDRELSEFEAQVARAATDGVVNDKPTPFTAEEMTPELVNQVLAMGRTFVESVIDEPGSETLAREIKSALGPIITGEGAFARLAFHPAYHQGQAHLIQTAPGFPR